MTLNGLMAVTLRYFTEFGKPAFQHIDLTISARKKESSRSLSHLLISFLFNLNNFLKLFPFSCVFYMCVCMSYVFCCHTAL